MSSSPSACRSASPVRAARSLISRAIAIRSPARPGVQRTSWRASRHAASVVGSSRVRARASACSESGRARGRCAGTEWCSSRARLAARWASSAVPRPCEPDERGLQLLDDGVAGHREPGAEPLHAQRHPGEPLGVPAGGRAAAGVVEQRPRLAGVARSGAGVGLLDEQVDEQPGRVRRPAVLDGAPGPGQVRRPPPRRPGGRSRRGPRDGPSPRPGRRPPAARPRRCGGPGRRRRRRRRGPGGVRARRRCCWCSRSRRGTSSPAATVSRNRSCASRAGAVGAADQHPGLHALLHEPGDGGRVVARDVGQHVGQQVVARHRGRLHQRPALARSSRSHAAGDDVAHGRRHRRRGPRADQQLGELPGEERVAVGAPVDLGGPACRRPRRPPRP